MLFLRSLFPTSQMLLSLTASLSLVLPQLSSSLPLPHFPSISPLTFTDDYDIIRFPPGPYTHLNLTTLNGTIPSTGRPFTAHAGLISDFSKFSFAVPAGGCVNHTVVTKAAVELGCDLATNAGFFAFTPPSCLNQLIVNSKTLLWEDTDTVNVGLTSSGHVVFGYLNSSSYKAFDFTSLVSGQGWLVRNGRSYVKESREYSPTDTFYTEKAPRTAMGVSKEGHLIMLVVDGIESTNAGPDLFEMTEVRRGFQGEMEGKWRMTRAGQARPY